jgi:hypothetical protein
MAEEETYSPKNIFNIDETGPSSTSSSLVDGDITYTKCHINVIVAKIIQLFTGASILSVQQYLLLT